MTTEPTRCDACTRCSTAWARWRSPSAAASTASRWPLRRTAMPARGSRCSTPCRPPCRRRRRERVEALAAREGWRLRRDRRRRVGATRTTWPTRSTAACYCKRALYTTIAATLAPHTDAQLLSGANLDDLGDYRPGLAGGARVRRAPSARRGRHRQGRPCASSRAASAWAGSPSCRPRPACRAGSRPASAIDAPMLGRIDAAERLLREDTGAADVRCRVRQAGVVIEIDADALARLGGERRERLAGRVAALFGRAWRGRAAALRGLPARQRLPEERP